MVLGSGKFFSFLFRLSKHLCFLHSLTISTKLLFSRPLLTGSYTDVNVRRDNEPEAPSHRGQVQVVYVVDLLQRVGLVGPDIGFVGLLGGDVEEVVLGYQLLQLGLNVGHLKI